MLRDVGAIRTGRTYKRGDIKGEEYCLKAVLPILSIDMKITDLAAQRARQK